MEDFVLRRDFKLINWGDTLKLNLIRSVIAGIVWMLVVLIIGDPVEQALKMLLFPVAYLIFLLPLGMLAIWLSNLGIPFIGLLSIIAALTIVVADPFMYILHKQKPELVPIDEYDFIVFRLIIFVLKEPEVI